jgi:hypothetical protein
MRVVTLGVWNSERVGFVPASHEAKPSGCAPEATRTDTNERERVSGGEGGIRTRHDSLDSVSCRFYIAAVAVNANNAVAPCTRLHPIAPDSTPRELR